MFNQNFVNFLVIFDYPVNQFLNFFPDHKDILCLSEFKFIGGF